MEPIEVDYSKVTDNEEIIEMLRERARLEEEIRKMDPMALVNYELEALKLKY
jgi:hypothetical protein